MKTNSIYIGRRQDISSILQPKEIVYVKVTSHTVIPLHDIRSIWHLLAIKRNLCKKEILQQDTSTITLRPATEVQYQDSMSFKTLKKQLSFYPYNY